MARLNRIIELEFFSDSGAENFRITCPRKGIKPNIQITGEFTSKDTISNFEIRIANLYTDSIGQYNNVRIYAGYENAVNFCIEGSIYNVYTESPGPEKITVITGTTANLNDWLVAKVNVSLPAGAMISDAARRLTMALGYGEPVINGSIMQKSPVPIQFNGLAKDYLHYLQKIWPDLDFVPDNNKLVISGEGIAQRKIVTLKYLKSAPQFNGGTITVNSLWEPNLRPEDSIKVLTDYYITEASSTVAAPNKDAAYKVTSVSFSFSTIGSDNDMTVVATAG